MGMVERRDVEFELIGDLHKMVSTSTAVTAKSPTYSNEVIKIDWWYTPINITASCTPGNTLPAS